MVAQQHGNMVRVSLTLDPIDVDLLDRMAALVGSNRSAEMRGVLEQLRPMVAATVAAFEAAVKQKHLLEQAAASATVAELESIQPEVERMQQQYLGMMAKLEGAAAAAAADPRPSNHGGHTPTPTTDPTTSEPGLEA